jgi:hypothetical protein
MSQTRRLQELGFPSYWIPLAALLLGMTVSLLAMKLSLLLLLAGAVLFGALLVFLRFPELATLLVLFVLYTNMAAVARTFHNVPVPVAASVFLLILIPFVIYTFVRGERLIIDRVLLCMLLYFVVMLFSTLFAEYFTEAAIRTLRYGVEGIVLYLLFVNVVRDWNTLRNAIWVMILAGSILGGLTLYQGLTHSYDNSFGGFAQVTDARMATGETDTGDDKNRLGLGGPLGEKNHFAQILTLLLPLAFIRFKVERGRFMRLLALASIIPITGGVVFAFSRAAALSVLVILGFMVYLRYLKAKIVVLGLVGFVLLLASVAPDFLFRISTIADLEDIRNADGSLQGRAALNLATFKIFIDHPVVGVGPGQVWRYTQDYGNQEGFKRLLIGMKAHNMYFELLAESGIFGFIAFISILFLLIRSLAGVRRIAAHLPSEYVHVANGFLLALAGYLFHGIFAQLSWERYFWLLVALSAVSCHLTDEWLAHRPPEPNVEAGSLAMRKAL